MVPFSWRKSSANKLRPILVVAWYYAISWLYTNDINRSFIIGKLCIEFLTRLHLVPPGGVFSSAKDMSPNSLMVSHRELFPSWLVVSCKWSGKLRNKRATVVRLMRVQLAKRNESVQLDCKMHLEHNCTWQQIPAARAIMQIKLLPREKLASGSPKTRCYARCLHSAKAQIQATTNVHSGLN